MLRAIGLVLLLLNVFSTLAENNVETKCRKTQSGSSPAKENTDPCIVHPKKTQSEAKPKMTDPRLFSKDTRVKPVLADPRLVLVGPTGAGKSSLANALLGCDPRAPTGSCMFTVCTGMDSCTKETSFGIGPWLGTGQNFTIVDTPGFGDSDNDDESLIEEMMGTLSHTIDHADTIVLVLDGRVTRFQDGLQRMIKRMTVMFGQSWWDFLVIGVSFWPYDQDSIDDRQCYPEYPEYCKDEAWYAQEINQQIKEKFGVDIQFSYVFTDSWSQTPGPPGFNTDDPTQQEHWHEEATKLWDITVNREESFGFMTIDDILEENAQQRAEIKWLNDVITNNISQLGAQIADNSLSIQDNRDSMDIVSGRVSTNGAHITQTNLRVDETEDKLDASLHPVGSIIAWLGAFKSETSLPPGWQLCDGSTIMHGLLAGQKTPDLNNAGLFLRGGSEAAVGDVEQDAVQNHHHLDTGHKHTENAHTHTAEEHDHHFHEDKVNGGYSSAIVAPSCAYSEWYAVYKSGYDVYYETNVDLKYCMKEVESVLPKASTIHSATASIQTAYTNLGGVDSGKDGARTASETRPKNMKTVFIMRIE